MSRQTIMQHVQVLGALILSALVTLSPALPGWSSEPLTESQDETLAAVPIGPVASDGGSYTPQEVDALIWIGIAPIYAPPRASAVTASWSGATGQHIWVATGMVAGVIPAVTNANSEYFPTPPVGGNTWTTDYPVPTRSEPGARCLVGFGRVQIGAFMGVVGGKSTAGLLPGFAYASCLGFNLVPGYGLPWGPWTVVPSLPEARYGHGAATTGFPPPGSGHVFGGHTLALGDDYRIYTPPGPWVVGPTLPNPMCFTAGASLSSYIFAIGSYGVVGTPTNTCYKRNTTLPGNLWMPMAPMPPPNRRFHAAVGNPVCNRVYVFGGEVEDTTTGAWIPSSAVLKYNNSSNTWAFDTPMPAARVWPNVGRDNSGRLYVMGGATTSAGIPVPSEVCWYAIDYSCQINYINLSLTPINPPIIIPAVGGNFQFQVSIANPEDSTQTFKVWTRIQGGDGAFYSGIGPLTLTLPAGFTLTRMRTQTVAGSLPAGTYSYIAQAWRTSDDNPIDGLVYGEDGFIFTKSDSGLGGPWVGEFENYGEPFGEDVPANTPADFVMLGNFPNPFNPTTAINFSLGNDDFVTLTVYDLAGRKVATLADGWLEAGSHSAVFDGSNLTSGVYLYRLTAGASSASGKMVLMK